jgi:hypothetical protein
MSGAASARSGACVRIAGDRSSVRWRVSVPRRSPPADSRTSARPATRLMSIRTAGRARRMFMSGTRLWPPARIFASDP